MTVALIYQRGHSVLPLHAFCCAGLLSENRDLVLTSTILQELQQPVMEQWSDTNRERRHSNTQNVSVPVPVPVGSSSSIQAQVLVLAGGSIFPLVRPDMVHRYLKCAPPDQKSASYTRSSPVLVNLLVLHLGTFGSCRTSRDLLQIDRRM